MCHSVMLFHGKDYSISIIKKLLHMEMVMLSLDTRRSTCSHLFNFELPKI